jgi:hypothetical protein
MDSERTDARRKIRRRVIPPVASDAAPGGVVCSIGSFGSMDRVSWSFSPAVRGINDVIFTAALFDLSGWVHSVGRSFHQSAACFLSGHWTVITPFINTK